MRRGGTGWRAVVPVMLAGAACGGAPGTGERAGDRVGDPLIACDADNGGLVLAPGLCALVVADDLGRARHLAVAPDGDIYVRLRTLEDGGGIVALRDTTGDGRADVIERFGDNAGTGIRVRAGWLYYSTDTAVYRVRLPEDGGLVPAAAPELLVGGFPPQRSHAAKTFTFDDAGYIYVNIGSPTNACQPVAQDRQYGVPGQDPCPEFANGQAGVWRFDADLPGQMQTQAQAYAVGLRNAMGLAWHPQVNALYAVQHGRDLLNVIAPDHFDVQDNAELPAEVLYRLEQGDTLHHPYCYEDPVQGRAVLAPEYGGDGLEVGRCGVYRRPLVSYPAHWAPNDMVIYRGGVLGERFRHGAFIAWHGSWNRAPEPQRGYKVTFQPLPDGEPAGDWEIIADGFAGVAEIRTPDEARFRPTGLAVGPDGSLYVSDSVRGRIWRILPGR
jgi:glucose/arabinose dehydrogenase